MNKIYRKKLEALKEHLNRPLPPPRPAFVPFCLTDENGDPIMRSVALHTGKDGWKAPDAFGEIHHLYNLACGRTEIWRNDTNMSGAVPQTEKFTPLAPITATGALVQLTLEAAWRVDQLCKRHPDLCREVANRLAVWPVIADRTDSAWQFKSRKLLADLKLGAGIEGFIRSAISSNRNVIRRYATGIFETLHQTRCQFEAVDVANKTRIGCPPWAEKTLSLPTFSRAGSAAWGRLGEEMLLEQRPNFLDDPELKEQAYKWKLRAEHRAFKRTGKAGNISRRMILREAFDDFRKELKKLAPTRKLHEQ